MSSVEYRVTHPHAPEEAVDKKMAQRVSRMLATVKARTPYDTGRLASGWKMVKRKDAEYVIENDVPYAGYVEHGTNHTPAHPMIGPVIQAARA